MKVTPINKCAHVAQRQREDAAIMRERRRANKEINEIEREVIRTALYRDGYPVTYTQSGRVKVWDCINTTAPILIGLFFLMPLVVM